MNHALLTQPDALFAANTLFPHAGSLAFNEHAFGIAILAQPWFWFSDNPVVPCNLLLLFSYFASALGMYFLCLRYTGSRAAAFVGGVVFGFCFFRAHHAVHITLVSTQWFPWVVLLFHQLRERFRWGLAIVWASLAVLQILTNWYLAFYLVLILLWIAGEDFLKKRPSGREAVGFAACGLLVLGAVIPFYIPYSRLPQPLDYAELKAFSADLGSYFTPALNTILGQFLGTEKRWIWEERSTYLGYITVALGIVGIWVGRRNRRTWVYLSLAAVAFVLSLGPESLDFPGVPLPARWAYWLFPPLAQLRAAARFAMWSVLLWQCYARSLSRAWLSYAAGPGPYRCSSWWRSCRSGCRFLHRPATLPTSRAPSICG